MDVAFYTSAKNEAGDCGNDPQHIPSWMDEAKFNRGRQFYKKFFFSVYLNCLSGLFCSMAIPSMLTTMQLTEQSNTTYKAFRRYLRTLQYMNLWYNSNLCHSTDDEGYRSVQEVRRIHAAVVRKQIAGLGQDSETVPISQYDMVLTQFAFMGLLVLSPFKLGIWYSRDEIEGLINFWRTVGYLLGVDEKYNLCSDSYQETHEKCRELLEREFIPALLNPPEGYEDMTKALLFGIKLIVPGLDYDSYFRFTMNLIGIPSKKSLTGYPLFRFWFQKIVCQGLLFIPWCRNFFNRLLQKSIAYAENRVRTSHLAVSES